MTLRSRFEWSLEDIQPILPIHLGGSRQVKLSSDDPVHIFPQEKPKYPSLQEAVGRSWSATEATFGKLKVRWFEVAGLKSTKADLSQEDMAALDAAIADFLREFAGADRSAEEFSSQESEDGILQQSLYLAHSVGIERAQNVTGTDLNATLSAAQRQALAQESFARLSEDGRLRFETRLDEIRQAMLDAFSRGDNPLDIAKQLGIGLTGYEQGRLRTIVRTEMGLASEAAIRTGYQQAGISRVEVIGDPNTDELCTVHIGKSYGLSELDSLPIYHPNCFCSTVPSQ